MCQFINCQFFVEKTEIGMITAPVFCAARMIPGFGIFSGPLGPSGVIAIKDGGLFNTFTISGKISKTVFELMAN